jgi:hypothetical protein
MKMKNTKRGFNTNAIMLKTDNPNSKAHYTITEDFKNKEPYELLFCEDKNVIQYEYNKKINSNQDKPYKIVLSFRDELGVETIIDSYEN